MSKSRYKYELIDNDTGNTLTSAMSASQGLQQADQYIRDYSISYDDVAYVILRNGAKTRVVFRVSGNELAELIEDEKDSLYPSVNEFYDPMDDIDSGWE